MKISIFLICACTLTAVEQTPGTFTATGSMITPRGEHSATLLQDGRVLIAGGANYGSDGFRLLASAELYDPATGTFSLTGSMTTARSGHTATLLPDGRVLITGGDPAGPKGEVRKSTAELYDPSTGLFTATGNMATGHGYSTATLLANGKVLINGGTAELYDPSTGAFTLTGPNAGSVGSTSTLLPDGRVLFAPGSEIYDPLTDKLSPTGSMVGSYFTDRTAALLTSGKVLIAGGEWDFGRVKDAELFDATTGAFTSTGDMTEPRSEHVAVLLPNGTVLITGGEGWGIGDFFGGKNVCCGFLGSLASTEIYDSSTGTFTATGDMSARREWHTSTVLNNGKVLITGGLSYGGIGIFYGSLASAELYTPPA